MCTGLKSTSKLPSITATFPTQLMLQILPNILHRFLQRFKSVKLDTFLYFCFVMAIRLVLMEFFSLMKVSHVYVLGLYECRL